MATGDEECGADRKAGRHVNEARVYLDHAATTPVLPEVIAVVTKVLANDFGNPSGVHRESRRARTLLEDSRDRIAAVFGANPHEIVFTGGGTEAVNLALTGTHPGSLAWSAVEHDAVRSSAAASARKGMTITELPVTAQGILDLDAPAFVDMRADVVAVMAVNNEVGTIQPIAQIAEKVHASGGVLVVDAVQALPWIDVKPVVAASDFVALSGHKFGAPKGVGALIVRGRRKIEPLLYGGGQEQERRSGTQNVAGIVAMAVAAEYTDQHRAASIVRIGGLRDSFVRLLTSEINGCHETVPTALKVAGNAHVCIEGIHNEELLVLIDTMGVAASAGSACASGALHLSPVLLAMGVPQSTAQGALRFTLGESSTQTDITNAARIVIDAVNRLRGTPKGAS